MTQPSGERELIDELLAKPPYYIYYVHMNFRKLRCPFCHETTPHRPENQQDIEHSPSCWITRAKQLTKDSTHA